MHLLFFFQAVHLCDEVAGDVAFLPSAEGFCQPPLSLAEKKSKKCECPEEVSQQAKGARST